ncbi:MAG: efflux RND transporter periplasmic adaptor subunit [Pseudohongiellaceae bacterium]
MSVGILGVVAGFLAGIWFTGEQASAPEIAAGSPGREPLYWVAPMDPSFRRDEPGLSPMGMDLIPVFEEPDSESNAVSVASTIQQNLGLRTGKAIRTDFARDISAVGYTRWNEASIKMLHPRAEGWLEEFKLASVGDRVSAGQVVYELYAPNLVSAQQEFLTARQAGNEALASLARERLLALGFTAAQVEDLARNGSTSSRLVYRAVNDALVLSLGARRGSFVQPSSSIATLASLDTIWVDVDVFETDVADLAVGLEADIEFPAFPGERWSAAINYIYPELDSDSRTLRVRLLVDNADHRLKPNMFANVSIHADPRRDVLAVPREAVIRSGSGARVIVVLEDGRFQPRAVRTGVSSGERIEILQGLAAGETIVTSGQFLLDAEANGEQAMARLDASAQASQGAADTMAMPAESADDTGNTSDSEVIYATTYETRGRITNMMADGMVTLAHEPVPSLNWPAMTMGFTTHPAIDLDDYSVGDTVRFEFRQQDDGSYQIVVLTSAETNERTSQ